VAFLGPEQKVSDGIYPVLLYYREAKVLILAFGVSETKESASHWKESEGLETVATFLREKHSRDAERYGDSFVDAAFTIPDGLDAAKLTARLDAMIHVSLTSLSRSGFILRFLAEASRKWETFNN
jgi:5-methylcytosine-specific restriction protein B